VTTVVVAATVVVVVDVEVVVVDVEVVVVDVEVVLAGSDVTVVSVAVWPPQAVASSTSASAISTKPGRLFTSSFPCRAIRRRLPVAPGSAAATAQQGG
jgi:hypothetical protein